MSQLSDKQAYYDNAATYKPENKAQSMHTQESETFNHEIRKTRVGKEELAFLQELSLLVELQNHC